MFWNTLSTRAPYNERELKASRVKNLGRLLHTAFVDIGGEGAVTYYIHAAHAHFPDLIKRLPVDIMDASGSGIEQVNQEIKRTVKL
jgi:hypothetical protein